MKYKHVRMYMAPFIVFRRLGLISNPILGEFIVLFHKMTHNVKMKKRK